MLSVNSHVYFQYGKDRVAEFLAEAERDHLAELALGPSVPVRVRVANWLYAIAERIEGQPSCGPTLVQPHT